MIYDTRNFYPNHAPEMGAVITRFFKILGGKTEGIFTAV